MDVYINGAASKTPKVQGLELENGCQILEISRNPEFFFFQVPEVGLQGCMGSKSPPPKKKSILLGTGQCDGCMINDISIFHSNSFMPSPKHKKREGVKLSNVKSSPFPSSCDSRQDVQPLQGLRVASRGIQNAIEQT